MIRAGLLIIAVALGTVILARAALQTAVALPFIAAEAEARRGF